MNRNTALIVILAGAALFVGGFLLQFFLTQDTFWDRAGAWIGAICVFGILSYVYKENPVYRTLEHILLGLGMGFGTCIVYQQVLRDKWAKPMYAGFVAIFNGTATGQSYFDACLIFAAFFGALWYCQYSKKYMWLSRITIGVTAGAGAGLGIRGVSVQTLPQISSTFKNIVLTRSMAPNLSTAARIGESVQSFLFLFIVCCVLYYFFFSFRRESMLAKAPATMGRFFLMICFGAFFGNTFMSRVVILIERVNYLLYTWLSLPT